MLGSALEKTPPAFVKDVMVIAMKGDGNWVHFRDFRKWLPCGGPIVPMKMDIPQQPFIKWVRFLKMSMVVRIVVAAK